MSALAPAALESNVLALRLRELAGEERNVQVDFLLHLDEFDRRRAFVEVGHASLWAYCLEALHLREGAAGRRIQAMRVLRRFPILEAPLRDGRLCLSTVALLGQVLTEENVDDLLARAAFRTRAEVEQLVVSVQARTAPRAGLRKLTDRAPTAGSAALQLPASDAGQAETATEPGTAKPTLDPGPAADALPAPSPPVAQPKRRAETLAVSESHWSLRVTLDRACKEDLETLRSLLSHKVPDGDLAAVLHEAIRCAIQKHGKRKGAVAPERKTKGAKQAGNAATTKKTAAKPPATRTTIPAIVRRAVWTRDGGRCAWVGPDGCRCNSRWKLELDHIQPAALGGPSTFENLRLACRAHNLLHAERTFGREHMDRFRRDAGDGPSSLSRADVAPLRPVMQLGMWAP
ncbi:MULTISPECIES: HNH endonuclease signature motif containing protein [Anaeromyxobacter]|uniref:HNH endonuclease signature motif containing protein n=1 Tax=Anaeromyxobacter TaxID=161492 RepID=UPI001F5939F5|nr:MULTISPECIES: HNH endonuclease signature motif containing protein [unclassified Anaeromyxobacter]